MVVIDDDVKLGALVRELQTTPWVAVDTEADSLHAYPEKLCLIQISTAHGDHLVDPLSAVNLDPLLEVLNDHELIMHGADYDLRLLQKHHEFVPSALFDTMLAARLLGFQQFSLSQLVSEFLGVKLEKGPQKANWAVRPLTERMERYAHNDTRFLKPLADRLREKLMACGRVSWHEESCEALVAESTRPREIDYDAVWRIKGSHRLDRWGLAVLRELWKWREHEAVSSNKPPFFILSHESLVNVAAAAARSRPVDEFLPRHLTNRRRSELLKALQRARSLTSEDFPHPRKPVGRPPTEAEKRQFLELQRRRDAQAQVLGIDATLIASRATLSDLAHDWDRNSGKLMTWQRNVLAEQTTASRTPAEADPTGIKTRG